MVRSPSRIWWVGALFALTLAGCYEDGEDQIISERDGALPPDAAGCTVGERRPCDVVDGCGGSQACLGDGTYGPCVAPDEICDGIDNDCDGAIDEEFPDVGDACAAGEGTCRDEGRVVCTPDGSDTMCDAQAGDNTDEVCDGVDNDCDGTTDEEVGAGVACETNLPGVCSAGVSACTDGDTVCEPSTEPSDETCDGLDNDCDTNVDEGENGGALAESCYADGEGNAGPEGTEGVGACVAGVRMCSDGMFGACVDAVLPMDEVCDGIDNDCDGTVDNVAEGDCVCEPGTTEDCYDGPDGTDGVGVCQGGVRTCNETGTGYGECVGQRLPGVELCDGADNDCNGEIDDVSGVGEACMEGQGECMAEGQRVCDPETGLVVCDAQPELPGDEICDGLDNDCDGTVDDVEGAGENCEVGVGACLAGGVQVCDLKAGGLVCDAVEGDPVAEVCDGIDNDCNGEVDDVDGVGEDCAVGVGACRSTGVTTCDPDGGGVICPATEQDQPSPIDYCDNGIDDDCDGETDEDDCIIPCEVDDDCRGAGETCVDGACVFTACASDDDCAPDQQCIDEVCVDDEICDDDIDNDGDGDTDCADDECAEDPACFQDSGCGVAQVVGFGTYQAMVAGESVIATAACASPTDTAGPEAVFVFTADAAGEVCVDTLGSMVDTILTVRGEPCEADGSVIGCNDDAGGDFETGSQVGFSAMAGSTYYFVADTFEGTEGMVTLTVTDGPCAPVPGTEICDNDDDDDDDGLVDCLDEDCAGDPICQDPTLCDEAMPLDLGRTAGMAMGPSRTSAASCTLPVNGADGPEMVYAFVPEDGGTYCIDTRGSMIDTVLTVRGEPCDDPAGEIACNDDFGMGFDASSEVEVELMDGATYYVIVDTFAGGGGNFFVNVREGSCGDDPVEICDDGFDNDGNGDVDCDDIACALDPACPILGDENCGDDVDNDGDGDVDCADSDCNLSPLCVEDCNNGVDDDADGDVDCDDIECALDLDCVFGPDEICDNEQDDDDDGLTDCDDADCVDDPFCQQDYACEDAIPVVFGSVEGTLDGESRTSLASCSLPPNDAAGPEAVYVFTPAADGEFCVDTDTAGLFAVDTILTVRVDPCNDPGSEVGCNDDADFILGTDSEVTVAGTAGTPYYIVVDSYEGDSGDFTLNVTPGNCDDPQPVEDCNNGVDDDGDGASDCEDTDCAADPVCDVCIDADDEPGDDIGNATPIAPGEYDGYAICPAGDNDVFAIDYCAGGQLDASITFEGGGGAGGGIDLDLFLFDADGNQLDSGFTLQSTESVEFSGGEAQTLYLDANGDDSGDQGPYSLVITLVCPEPEICDDDQDNDLDGDTDCDDADCADDPACADIARACDNPRPIGLETLTVQLEGDSNIDNATCTLPPDSAAGPEGVFVFTAEAPGTVCVDTLGSRLDTILTVRGEPCEGPGSEVACDDDAGPAGTSQVEFAAELDGTYFIVVDTFEGDSGEAMVTVSAGPCEPVGPVEICNDGADNDDDGLIDCEDAACTDDPICNDPLACDGAAEIGFGTERGTLDGESAISQASCALPIDGAAGPEMVYAFVPDAPGTVCADTLGSAVDTILTARTEACVGGEIACSDDADGFASEVEFDVEAGMTYYLVVDSYAGDGGDFALRLRPTGCDVPVPAELCIGGLDEDLDGLVDCDDPDCADSALCGDPADQCAYDFEDGEFAPEFEDGGDAPWTIEGGVATSGAIDDNDVSILRLAVSTPAGGSVAFRYRVSSENNFDDFRFLIDGVVVLEESGEVPFTDFEIALLPGDHVLEWVYDKDNSSLDGDDQAQIDDLVVSGTGGECTPEDCNNGVDDDGDGLADCEDDECAGELICADPDTLCTYDFEDGAFDAAFEDAGDAPWTIEGGVATSGDIGDSQSSTLRLAVSTPAGGGVAFRYRVSSEGLFLGLPTDFLTFSVDGVAVLTDFDNPDFTDFEVALLPGDHVLEWTYQKDGSASTGEDRAQIDDLVISGVEGLCDAAPVEICAGGVDDDGDGDIDCLDADCADDPACDAPVGDGAVYFLVNDGGFPSESELHVRDGDGDATLVGPITLDGQPASVEAIALTPDGILYGFLVGKGTLVIEIDPVTAEGTIVNNNDGEPIIIDDIVFGAGAAPDGTIYLLMGNSQTVAPFDGRTVGAAVTNLPSFFQFGDIAFDPNGTCYLAGVDIAGEPTGLYTCDLEAGTFDLLGDASQGFDDPAAAVGLAVGPGGDPCLGALYGSEVRGDDEYGVYDLTADPPLLTRVGDVGIDFAPPDFGDAAGWYTPPDDPACEVVVEICEGGVDDDGDGAIDCDDADCADDPACDVRPATNEVYFLVTDPDFAANAELYVRDGDGDATRVGAFEFGQIIFTAITMGPDGTLYGFGYDFRGSSQVATIDPETAEATFVTDDDGFPVTIDNFIFGAGTAPDGTMYVLTESPRNVVPFNGAEFGEPVAELPVPMRDGDIAFDGQGQCYLTAVGSAGEPLGLYRCDLDVGAFEPIGGADAGFDEQAAPSGLAFGPSDGDPCRGTLYASDARGIDEYGVYDLDVDPPLLTRAGAIGGDFATPDLTDAAGFYFAPDLPGCEDARVEICVGGVDDDGDGDIDCEDPDCADDPDCVVEQPACADAPPVSFGRTRGDTTGGVSNYNEASCLFDGGASGTGPEDIYTFTVDETQTVCMHTNGSSFDTQLYVRRDPCDALGSEVACDEDSGEGTRSILEFEAQAGETYSVFVDGYNGQSGEYVLTIYPGPCDEGVTYFVETGRDGRSSRLYVREGAADPALVGAITLDGQPIYIVAIALTPDGTLYGGLRVGGNQAEIVTIDPETAEAEYVVDGEDNPIVFDIGGSVIGAGAAPDGTVYLMTGRALFPFDGTTVGQGIALPEIFDAGDIAFDNAGNCYVTGVDMAGINRLYTCDVDAGTFTEINSAYEGFDFPLVYGLAVAGGVDPCVGSLYGLVYANGSLEYGVYDLDAEPALLSRIGVVADEPVGSRADAAGWFNRPDLPECELPVEICEGDVDEDGDGDTDCEDPDCAGDPACPAPLDGELVITEVMKNPSGSDNRTEWFELYNGTEAPIDLSGWTLRDDGSDAEVIEGPLVIAPDQYLTFVDGLESGFAPGYVMRMTLGNGDDEIVFVDLDGVERVRLNYTAADYPNTVGASMQLDSRVAKTAANVADSSNWCDGTQLYRQVPEGDDFATPGAPNDPCGPVAPEPMPISAPAESFDIDGSFDRGDSVWALPTQDCQARGDGQAYPYDVYYLVNETGAPQRITATGTWPDNFTGSGMMHAWTEPFDPDALDGCIHGSIDGANGRTDRLPLTEIAPGEVLVLVVSSTTPDPDGGMAPIGGVPAPYFGAYTVTVETASLDPEPVDYCILQFPDTIEGAPGDEEFVYGRVYEQGITDGPPGTHYNPYLSAQLGYIADGDDPSDGANWTWIDAELNRAFVGIGDQANNDEYQATLTVPEPGLYSYAYRFSADGMESWTLCDLDGSGANLDGGDGSSFSLNEAGIMDVNAAAPSACEQACQDLVGCFGPALFGDVDDCIQQCEGDAFTEEQAQCVADFLEPGVECSPNVFDVCGIE